RPGCPAGVTELPGQVDAPGPGPRPSWPRDHGGREEAPMRPEADVRAYVQDLEKHLQLTLFGGGMADPEGAVLLVRGALADGDRDRAATLARQTQRLATTTPGNPDVAAAAAHARGLIDQDAAVLQQAAGPPPAPRGPAGRLGGRRDR